MYPAKNEPCVIDKAVRLPRDHTICWHQDIAWAAARCVIVLAIDGQVIIVGLHYVRCRSHGGGIGYLNCAVLIVTIAACTVRDAALGIELAELGTGGNRE